ncbi:MAG: hypothetical protein ABJO01_15740 [Parasphingorhabdus sp.]|uniref:hypothetical protein n=1 Tax=Parasphingorhabdus sp. TaxID=2709688 RepID=UPI003299084E
MTFLPKISIIALLSLSAAACSDDAEAPEAETVTETRMDEVDVIDGTINDDMVDVDAEETGDELAEGSDAESESDNSSESDDEE